MDGSIIEEVKPVRTETRASGRTGGGTGGDTKGKSSTDTTATGGGTGGRTTGGGTGGKTTTEKEVISRLADVEEQKRIERNAKRRERYAKQKAEGTLKPKKVNTKKKAKEETLGTEQVETLIKTISVMVSSRQGQEHWLLLDSEVKAISEPLTNILKDSNAFSSISEHSNAVALVIACITIILPRTIKSISDINKKKKKEKEVLKNVEPRRSKGKNNTNDKGNNGNTSANGANHGTNTIWYGDAISL